MRTYDEAEKACAQLENSPTLAIIHSQEEQDFLVNYLFRTLKKVDNVWVGAKFSSNVFHWVDNSSLTYTNWDSKGAHNKSNFCVQMLADEVTLGKWIDEPCERKNVVVCQKMQTWTMARLQEAFLETRKQLTDALDMASKKLDEANKKINNLEKNQIPIGFIYTQLPNEKAPTAIWPSMTWSDVSASYAGVFFRVQGSGSEPFGQTQAENAPRVVRIIRRYSRIGQSEIYSNFTFDSNVVDQNTKIIQGIHTGSNSKEGYLHGDFFVSFEESTGEIRSRNIAIRVWKRIG